MGLTVTFNCTQPVGSGQGEPPPSAFTKIVVVTGVVVATVSQVNVGPVPRRVPVHGPVPLYHFQTGGVDGSVPKLPPERVSVVLSPLHKEVSPIILVGKIEDLNIYQVVTFGCELVQPEIQPCRNVLIMTESTPIVLIRLALE